MARKWPEAEVELPNGEWVRDGHKLRFEPAPDAPSTWRDDWTKPVPQCGTPAGYDAHRRRHEKTCPACRAAYTEHRKKSRPPTPRALLPHGTHAAFNRHKKYGEDPCNECRAGESDYQHAYRQARKPPPKPRSVGRPRIEVDGWTEEGLLEARRLHRKGVRNPTVNEGNRIYARLTQRRARARARTEHEEAA